MKNIILVAKDPWETRVAVIKDNVLQDLYFDKKDNPNIEKNFIKGKVSKILPGVDTAFVDIGQKKAGYLHISDVDKSLALNNLAEFGEFSSRGQGEASPEKKKRSKKTQSNSQRGIASFFKLNEQIIVQVKKESIDHKGAKITTFYTIPGKYLVLMPNVDHIGVSRKISSNAERSRLKKIADTILPQGMGAIMRTDAQEKSEKELSQDLEFLLQTWSDIQKKFKSAQVGESLYSDFSLSLKTLREHVDEEEFSVFCNDKAELKLMEAFAKKFIPNNHVEFELDNADLFERFNVNAEIENLLNKKVELKSGGNIVIEHTEALTVVDVNSSKFVGKKTQEETTIKLNCEAAREVVRQLRLRNIGGIIVIDFIDMNTEENSKKLMNVLHEELKKKDKFKTMTLKISELGLIQMTRKRSGKSLNQYLMKNCTGCSGLGLVKTEETMSFNVLRSLRRELSQNTVKCKKVELYISKQVFDFLSKKEYQFILSLEAIYNLKIFLALEKKFELDQFKILWFSELKK